MTRIIAGFAGSLRLAVPKSGTRPTSDRVREAIFSALEAADAIAGARVLDLYAGSGALGLEAASRGAAEVQLVERDVKSAGVAKRNAALVAGAAGGTGTRAGGRNGSAADTPRGTVDKSRPRIGVAAAAVQSWLGGAAGTAGWDLVFLDPPYDLAEDALADALTALVPHLSEDAIVVVERSTRSPEPVVPDGLVLERSRNYGESVVHWLRRA